MKLSIYEEKLGDLQCAQLIFDYLDIYCDGVVVCLKGWRGDKGSEPNWRERHKSLKNNDKKNLNLLDSSCILCLIVSSCHS